MGNDTGACLQAALDYLKAGIVPVCVTHPSDSHPAAGKAPRQSGWQRIAPSPVIVSNWFKRPSNLGVLCGRRSALVCVDVDPRNGGMRWLFENEERLGFHLREHTGSGGFHLYYRYPAGVDAVPSLTGQDGLAPGVELKADGGHQVVTWPSVHPCGGVYHFEHELSLLDLEAEADELPAWILEIAVDKKRVAVASDAAVPTLADCPHELERAIDSLRRHGPAVQGHGGDKHTFRAACIGGNYGITAKAWWPHLLAWNDTCTPPWERAELAKKMSSAQRSGAKDFGKWTVASDFPPDVEEPKTLAPAEAVEQLEELGVEKYRYTNPVVSARKFLSGIGGYSRSQGVHYLYENDTWNVVPDAYIRSNLRKAILCSTPDASVKTKHLSEIIAVLEDLNYHQQPAFDSWVDGRPGDFIRVANGILDLNRLTLFPHSRDWFSCTKLPFAYEPDARCPHFEAFLDSIWGSKRDNILALQLWFGYVLSRQTSQQKFAMFLGRSRSGKGTILRLLEALVGSDNSLALKLSSFRDTHALERTPGKKIITIGDAHSGSQDAASAAAEFILNVSGEDTIPINPKNKPMYSMRLPAKINLAANKMPKFVDVEGAITNRMLLFWFTRTFKGQEDTKLESKLNSELPGILNWALDGYQKFVERGTLLQSEEGKARLEELGESMNPIDDFFSTFVEYSPLPGAEAPILMVEDVYEVYKSWCVSTKHLPLAKAKLSAEITSYFCDKDDVKRGQTKGGRAAPRKTFYTNLKLVCSDLDYRSQSVAHDFPTTPGGAFDVDDDDFI